MAPRASTATWLVAVALTALDPALGRAQELTEPELPMEMEAPFAFSVNHVPKGDIIIVLRGEEVFVSRQDLSDAGIAPLEGEDVLAAGRPMLRLSSVVPPLRYELDEEQIALRVFAPPEMLPHTVIDLAEKPPDIEYSRSTSAFINYAPRIDQDGNLRLYEETGLSFDGKLLFSSAYISNVGKPARGVTNLVVDDRPTLRRWTFGDTLVRSGPLGSGGFVGGVTLTKQYSLDPYAVKAPGIGFSGLTETPATVEVLIDGTRVHTEEILPGTFEVKNLKVGGGQGFSGYVIRDVFGEEHRVDEPFYSSVDALAEGVEEYTYSMGLLREQVGVESWDYKPPVGVALHRRGLNDYLTAGGRAEVTGERVSAGPTLTVSTDFGQLDIDLAGSGDRSGRHGLAAQMHYTFGSRPFGANVAWTVRSDHYSNLQLSPDDDRAVISAAAAAWAPFTDGLSMGYQTRVEHERDAGLSTLMGLQIGWRLTRRMNLSIVTTRRTREGKRTDFEAIAALNFAWREHHARMSGETGTRRKAYRYDISNVLPPGEGVGYRGAFDVSKDVTLDADVRYQALFGRYGLRYNERPGRRSLTLDAAGALVVVPGVGIFPALPVRTAFGLIRVKGIEGVSGYGNHQLLGKTDRDGNLVIPSLGVYYGNHLSIAADDVPIDRSLETTEMVLAPPPRGVALADFEHSVPHFYRGTIQVQRSDGSRVAPTYGQVVITQMGEDVVSPLGLEGEFELLDIKPGTQAALVEWKDGACRFEMTFPDSEETVIDLGPLVCHDPPRVEPGD